MIAFFFLVNLLLLPISFALLISGHDLGWTSERSRCLSCHYDLRGIQGSICPECGDDQVGRQAFREGQKRARTMAGILLLGFAIVVDFFALVLAVMFLL